MSQAINVEDTREINILLLGETGVGKSTFINAFINYVTFSTLSEAMGKNLESVIPSRFTITDENYEERIVQVGKDHNESMEVGASATQACRSYVYPLQGTDLKLRLIDTPGVGDTRGIDQDKINFENVMTFIAEFNYLNAICILLKPNNSRLTVMFEFCIKQLLSKLEKSASKNLIFVFTNTRSTFYRPGETLPSLRKLLSSLKGIDIPCEKKNIFCTDNESFRFLAALNSNIRFSDNDVLSFSQSWVQSSEECERLITYVVGDDENPGLIPHEVKNTISLNEARRLIVQLSRPLAEIVQIIQYNISALDRHEKELRLTDTTLSRLKTKLYMPIVDLKVMELDQPTTVCTSLKCSTVYQVGDKKKWHYHQKCHAPCYLINVPKEIIGSPELINCAAMDSQGECRQCTCRYQVHMHIYYITETFERKLEDQSVKTRILSKQQALKHVQNLTLTIHARIATLEIERETVLKTTAKFACFLKTNAIAPYNDAYEAYLKYLIDRENSLNEATDFELIKQLERMLHEYSEEKTTIMNAMSLAVDAMATINAVDILDAINSLYSLEIFGAKIKELFEAQNRARKDENKSETKEYVYSVKSRIENAVSHFFGRGKKREKLNSSNIKPDNNFTRRNIHSNQNVSEVDVTPSTSFSSDQRQFYCLHQYRNLYEVSISRRMYPYYY
ncbi:hypothetical protein FQR65_LT06231 [Abscondita terminalis]|nr:hypothetical protein FQR65_LT06231 [Abscondita terminalis]